MKRTYTKIESIKEGTLQGGVKVSATLDTRHERGKGIPVEVRVCYQRSYFHYATGVTLPLVPDGDTLDDYEAIRISRGVKGKYAELKKSIIAVYDRIEDVCNELLAKRRFSLTALRDEMKPRVMDVLDSPSLFQLWQDFAGTKSMKTADQYRQSCVSFFKSRGCKTSRVIQEDGTKSRRMELQGSALKMKPVEVTTGVINEWVRNMSESGNSAATIAMNLRAMKALLNSLIEDGTIQELPKFKIKSGGKRDEDVLPVRDILKIMNYEGEYKDMASWWMIVYLSNGANVRDLAELKYTDSYQYDHTLNFIRHKTHSKSPSKVVVPVIPELQALLDKYAAPYKPGELVFPDIFGTAVSESQKLSRVHDFCAWIREGMAEVCKSLNIRPATVNTARHTFATVLKAHGIPTDFIDIAMGHSRKEISSFYVTMFAEQRQKINALLLQEPKGLPTMNNH